MASIFYIAALFAVLSSVKTVTSIQSIRALLYFIVSLLSTAVVFSIMGAYFSAALVVILFIGAVCILFLAALSFLKLKADTIEQNKYGISPKIWLGPLILAFLLFVMLMYCIVSTDYQLLQIARTEESGIAELLLSSYILVIELAILLLLGALVIAYHFIYRIYSNSIKTLD